MIVPDVYTWSWFSEPHGYDFNGYLVVHSDGNLCIDPVVPGDDLAEIERLGVAKILITNRNHSRAANAVRERTGASISSSCTAKRAYHLWFAGTTYQGASGVDVRSKTSRYACM